ncbi:MAG: YjgN family protein [Geminicoccaceae bacterium]
MAVALDQDYRESQAVEVDDRPGLPFTFTGRAGEYFGIWIVNILLSIVTLGIYSAWAKVRNKRYFYGNTVLKDSSFNYLASPIQILKGRIIMFAFFVAYALCSSFYPTLAGVFIVLMFIITPWVVIRALAFNARNSSYRNVRFNFTGQLWEAVKIYLLLPIGIVFTLGGLLPYSAFRMKKFVANHSHYGQIRFNFGGTKGAYFKAYGIALLFALPVVLLYAAFMAAVVYAAVQTENLGDEEAEVAMIQFFQSWGESFAGGSLLFIALAAAILAVIGYTYLTTRLQNYFFNNTKIGEHQLFLDLNLWQVLWIRLSNLLVIALTIGLMIPWARIRMTRYQIERMSLIPHGDLDTLVGEQQGNVAAYGDELGEGMDLDLGLGV